MDVPSTRVNSVCGKGLQRDPIQRCQGSQDEPTGKEWLRDAEAKPASAAEGSRGPSKARVCLGRDWAPVMVILLGEGKEAET